MTYRHTLIGLGLLASCPAWAQVTAVADEGDWSRTAHFFIGGRGGVAVPPGGKGVSPTVGLELGVANTHGIGFGLHLLGSTNTPAVPAMNIPTATYGLGAAVDMRFYFETVEPLTLYPTLSLGFMAGPAKGDGTNVVLPMINPGFGARLKTANLYTSFEFGLASFLIPFVNLAIGYELDKPKPAPRPLAPPCVTPTPAPPVALGTLE